MASPAGISRRTFNWLTAATAPGFFATHGFGARADEGPADRLNLAAIGIGGRGTANIGGLKGQNIVALCDVDQHRAAKVFDEFPSVRRFTDFRKMFDAMEREIDGVVISTPDHTHFHPAWWAMERGKHVYLEKPLAHEVEEVRLLTEMARNKGLATQLGSQRHAETGLREGVELAKSGLLGTITDVHSWISSKRGMPNPQPEVLPVPPGLDWDLWLGPTPMRPYTKGFAPYDWRFWWEFGTGETGNWGCHILDIPFWALELGHPVRVAASGPEPDPVRTPKELVSRFDFPARRSAAGAELPPVSVHWYQGRPPILADRGIDDTMAKEKNTLFIGTAGMLLCGFDKWLLLPEREFAEVRESPRTLTPSPGFYQEWIEACRGGAPATCNFDATGPLAEAVLLANIAYRVQGEFDWDAAAMKSSRDDVDALLQREYRAGWQVHRG